MSKVSCDIIKDLLPSYIEDICSEDTKKFVNCHLKECKDCRELTKMMKKTELVSEQTEQKMVDSVKKVKKHIRKITGFGILVGLFGIVRAMFLERFDMVPISFYYLAMPIFLVILHSILLDYKGKQKRTKWSIGLGIVETVLIGYSILLEFRCIQWIQSGQYPFGWEESRIGIFLSYQFGISTIIQGILFIIAMWTDIKMKISNRMVMKECILGICINLVFLSLLKRMDTLEGFIRIRNQTLGIVVGEWILVVGILWIFSLYHNKK